MKQTKRNQLRINSRTQNEMQFDSINIYVIERTRINKRILSDQRRMKKNKRNNSFRSYNLIRGSNEQRTKKEAQLLTNE
ncbi:hypothetical protein [Bacillus cereus]|uniref:hypothetical protein n=1 Tax=Bacillus cereus TaxID=1396 RepID=UPI001C3F19D4|nr:hypothetical protein [Bacillus cereus]